MTLLVYYRTYKYEGLTFGSRELQIFLHCKPQFVMLRDPYVSIAVGIELILSVIILNWIDTLIPLRTYFSFFMV